MIYLLIYLVIGFIYTLSLMVRDWYDGFDLNLLDIAVRVPVVTIFWPIPFFDEISNKFYVIDWRKTRIKGRGKK